MAAKIMHYVPLGLATIIGCYLFLLVWKHTQVEMKATSKAKTSIRNYHKYPVTSYPAILEDDKYVRNCVTGEIFGEIPGNLKTKPLETHKSGSVETSNARKDSFKQVFNARAWGTEGKEPGLHSSGPGSTLSYSQEMMAILHSVISEVRARHNLSKVRLLDAPCGDMAWMSRFVQTRDDVLYTGIDIVPELIQHHKKEYGSNPRMQFIEADLAQAPLNETYDVILNRMALQHLMFADVKKLLGTFSNGARYLLATTHMLVPANAELHIKESNAVKDKRYRALNLEIPPISLTPPLCIHRDGPPGTPHGRTHFIGMWKLPLTVHADCKNSSSFTLRSTGQEVYSCVPWE